MFWFYELLETVEDEEIRELLEEVHEQAYDEGFNDGCKHQQKQNCGKCSLYYGQYKRANFDKLAEQYLLGA